MFKTAKPAINMCTGAEILMLEKKGSILFPQVISSKHHKHHPEAIPKSGKNPGFHRNNLGKAQDKLGIVWE